MYVLYLQSNSVFFLIKKESFETQYGQTPFWKA